MEMDARATRQGRLRRLPVTLTPVDVGWLPIPVTGDEDNKLLCSVPVRKRRGYDTRNLVLGRLADADADASPARTACCAPANKGYLQALQLSIALRPRALALSSLYLAGSVERPYVRSDGHTRVTLREHP